MSGAATGASAHAAGRLEDHEHEWGAIEHATFTGNPHRKCKHCKQITLDLYDDDDGVLGSCGCVDYHYADCPTRQGVNHYGDESDYEEEEWR